MTQIQNPMEIFKLLEKSNCRKCSEPTCLAFAAAVFKGTRQLEECPGLAPEILARYSDNTQKLKTVEQDAEEAMRRLRQNIEKIDLAQVASSVGGVYSKGKLTLKILGKDFNVDPKGRCSSDIHINRWVTMPVLQYILQAGGSPVSGNWVPLRELEGGKDWYRLFGQRCEKPLKRVADTYTDLFEHMVRLFNGRQVEGHFDSDISVVLHPLPKVPMLICYWKPEDGLESDLHLFFDENVEANLNIEALYTLATGMVVMLEKIAQRHG